MDRSIGNCGRLWTGTRKRGDMRAARGYPKGDMWSIPPYGPVHKEAWGGMDQVLMQRAPGGRGLRALYPSQFPPGP